VEAHAAATDVALATFVVACARLADAAEAGGQVRPALLVIVADAPALALVAAMLGRAVAIGLAGPAAPGDAALREKAVARSAALYAAALEAELAVAVDVARQGWQRWSRQSKPEGQSSLPRQGPQLPSARQERSAKHCSVEVQLWQTPWRQPRSRLGQSPGSAQA